MSFGSGVVARDSASEPRTHDDPRRIPGGEVRRDWIEVVAPIAGSEQAIAAQIDGGCRMGREEKWGRPVEAIAARGIRRRARPNCSECAGDLLRFRPQRISPCDDDRVFEDARPVASASAHDYRARVLPDIEAPGVSAL